MSTLSEDFYGLFTPEKIFIVGELWVNKFDK